MDKGVFILIILFPVYLSCCNSDDSSTDSVETDGDIDNEFDEVDEIEHENDIDSTEGDFENDEVNEALRFLAVSFNTGTSEGMSHDSGPDDGYTSEHALLSDEYYGDGLAWIPAVEAAAEWFDEVSPDLVAFQEIFYSPECIEIPPEAKEDFICENWLTGQATVAQVILGEGWQLMCHIGKPDKCAAVNRRFGSFRGCESDFCLEGLDGARVEDCGSGSRIGRGIIDLVAGGTLTLVSVHGSSGIFADDQQCRVRQFEQIFVDLGDGEAAASGERNLIMGDFNTDPAKLTSDPSAQILNDYVGEGKRFHWITGTGEEAEPTYAGLFNIDHVISDAATGNCWHAGVSEGHDDVIDAVYFDHKPVVCEMELFGR